MELLHSWTKSYINSPDKKNLLPLNQRGGNTHKGPRVWPTTWTIHSHCHIRNCQRFLFIQAQCRVIITYILHTNYVIWTAVKYNYGVDTSWSTCLVSGLGSVPELELELELQAMGLELELQNAIDRNWNGIEDSISIQPSIRLAFPHFLLLMAHIDVLRIADVFFKERICFKISYCKKISVIEL